MLNVFALTEDVAAPFVHTGHRIEFVSCDGIYAASEQVDDRPALSEAALRTQHDIVAAIAARVDAVLPARFGSVVQGEELTRMVLRRRDAIREGFDLVRGRAQMSVRLLTAEAPPSPALAFARTGAVSGTAYLQERRSAAEPVLPQGVASITAAVRSLVAAERAEPGQGRVAATVYHLVDRGGIGRYRRALEVLQRRFAPGTLTVSGPWPPFAFVPDLWL